MSLKNIFELIMENIDMIYEMKRIEKLITEDLCLEYHGVSYTLESFIDKYCFSDWKQRSRCLSCEDMRTKLKIGNILNTNNYALNNEMIFIYFQYVSNIYTLAKNFKAFYYFSKFKTFYLIEENINSILNDLNHELKYFEDEQMVIIVEKNKSATAVAEIVNKETAFKVIQYNHFKLKGELDKKKDILLTLGLEFESKVIAIKNNYNSLVDDVNFLLNNINIRHDNLKGKNRKEFTANLSPELLESWYDRTYDLLLLGILSEKYVTSRDDIKDLKTNF